MRNRQFDSRQWSVSNGPLVVLGEYKNRDGPLIYHKRDGPLFVTGPPGGTDPPAGTGPPYEARPPGRTGPRHETGPPNGHGPPLKKKQAGVEFESTKVKEKQNINLKREETKMKNFKLKRLLSLATVGLITALHMPTVFAAAGDTIGNRATLTFDVGGSAIVLESSLAGNVNTGLGLGTDTDFIEDRVINFTVATVDITTVSVASGATAQVQTFTVTNNGNGTQDFLLSPIDLPTTTVDPYGGNNDTFDTTSSVFVEDGTTAGYQLAEDTAIFLDELAAGAPAETVYIVSTIPGALADAQVAVLALVAQVAVGGAVAADDAVIANAGAEITNDDNGNISPAGAFGNPGQTRATVAGTPNDVADIITGGGAEQIVFNDPAGAIVSDVDSGGTVQDVIQNGQHSSSGSFTIGAAILTVQKVSAVLWDPANGNSNPKAIPGAYVQYTITVSNDALAGASGDLTTLADILVLTDLDPDLINGTAAALAPPGAPESAVGDSVRINTAGTARPSAGTTYCTGDVGDGDNDGCAYSGGVGGTLNVVLSDPLAVPSIAAMAAEVGYTEGELKPGESVVLVFNAIVQ